MKVPLHAVVATAIRDRITRGELPIGSTLPSEADLCLEFGSSRGPVRQALAQLRSEGLIQTSQGRVPVVRARPLEHSIDDFFSFTAWVQSTGRVPGQKTVELSRRVPPDDAAARLGLGDGEEAVLLVRLRTIDAVPVMLERSWYIEPVGREIFAFDPDAGSVFGALLERGVPLDLGTHTIAAIAADPVDAEQLDVAPGTPLLRVERITAAEQGTVIEYADDRYRTDRAALTIRNSRSTSAVSRPSVVRDLAPEHH